MKPILVTGGAGFIGSFLCERLLKDGHEVICLDNFFSCSKDNIAELMDHPRFELIRHDVIHPIYLEVGQIYNLACPASPVYYQNNPIKTVKTNVLGSINMLGLAKRVNASILQASTSEVYGDPTVHPQSESYWGNVNPIGSRSCYDEGKRVAETLMVEYRQQNQVDAKIVRIFNTYGPRMHKDDGRVVSNFVVQVLNNKPITIYGNGTQTRSFCYVSDLVEGLVLMQQCQGFYGPVNLGNPEEISILALAELLKEMAGSRSKIKFMDALQDDPAQRKPDISLAKEKLGWAPTISLKEGLQRTLDYFEEHLSLTSSA